ncbi:MAG TPA: hypothetical protein VM406_01420 [Noviherbaspirillum sp.]|nr:hypothetical protein [Noviherbaspirillum sp.]
MSAVLHPHPAALLQSAETRHLEGSLLERLGARAGLSPALASLLPAFVSGAFAGAVVALALGGSFSQWLENWLVAWAVAFPLFYLAGTPLLRAVRFVSTPAKPEAAALGIADIASASARASQRHGFTVLRNLKVREDFYRA